MISGRCSWVFRWWLWEDYRFVILDTYRHCWSFSTMVRCSQILSLHLHFFFFSLSLSFFFSFFQRFCCFYILGLLKYAISLQMRWWIWAFSFFYHSLLLDSKWLAIKNSKCKVSNTCLYQMLGCAWLSSINFRTKCLAVLGCHPLTWTLN